nr:hypothetical protein BaRGS_017242 [Batillaria attramentaria]
MFWNSFALDGGWSEWDDWQDSDECSALCGGGAKDQWHIRRCDNPAPANDLCPEEENTFISNTNNAGRYYQCAHGVAILMNCPNGTVWNQNSTSCIHDGSQQVQEFLSQGDQCDSNVSLSPHQDCTKYIWCIHGVANEMSCPAGTRFNPEPIALKFPSRLSVEFDIGRSTCKEFNDSIKPSSMHEF